jgi:hypothetical protein
MEWLEELAGRLPALRDDEPPEIRRKIIAELRDHLQSAFERELLRTGNHDQARDNVLVQFGDPARLARKLWYDAMWEKIMSRRLMWSALCAVVLLSLGSLGLASFLVVQSRTATQALLEQSRAASEALLAESRSANQKLVSENRKANEALLAKMTALGGTGANAAKSLEWNPLRVRLVYEKTGGEPVSGFAVTAEGNLLDTGKKMSLERTSGADGIADFGLVRPGEHSINVVAPWGERLRNYSTTILPGEDRTAEIVCPRKVEEADVSITVDWPEELANKGLWLICDFARNSKNIDGHWWLPKDYIDYVAIDSLGKLIHFNHRLFPYRLEDPSRFFNSTQSEPTADKFGIYRVETSQPRTQRARTVQTTPPCVWMPAVAPVSRLRWPVGTCLTKMYCAARQSENDEQGMPADMLHPTLVVGIRIASNPRTPGRNDENMATARFANRDQGYELQTFHPDPKIEPAQFEVVAGKPNDWRISLPQPVVDLMLGKPVDGLTLEDRR